MMIDMDLETHLIILRFVERLAAILIGGFFTGWATGFSWTLQKRSGLIYKLGIS